jgi:hypothetical protein
LIFFNMCKIYLLDPSVSNVIFKIWLHFPYFSWFWLYYEIERWFINCVMYHFIVELK